jgi:putative flippase GtrA
VTTQRALPEASARMSRAASSISAVQLEPDPNAQFAGIDALRALAVTQPLTAVDLERLNRARNVAPRSADNVGLHPFVMDAASSAPVFPQQTSGLGQFARRHGGKLAMFSVIGAAVFAFGLVLQALLVREAGVGVVAAYAVQIVICIEIAYLLNRYLTWRDREVRFWTACARFTAQRVAVTIPSLLVYAGLIRLQMGYLVANAVTTTAFTIVNYAVGHFWSFAPDSETSSQRHRAPKHNVSLVGIAVVCAVLAAFCVIIRWPDSRWLVYAAWMMPMVELFFLLIGQMVFRLRFREALPGTFTELIIQITTAGREHARVTEIIEQIRSYRLPMNYRIWVVTEPGHREDYLLADRVLVVPERFAARSGKKARALEYSRRVRESLGLDRPDVKIVFNDDDVTLTRGYIERAFAADYDICEGVVTPRTHYAVRPFGHFLTSHADDIRTHACLVYCSVFQGILGRPVHVHGEGMVVTGAAERIVTWDWPVIASEDLVFGQRAVAAGLRWGWFHEYAEVTSPWTLRDYLIQRQRWLWGDIHAIRYRAVMSASAAALVLVKYAAGVLALVCSAAGLWLRLTGKIPSTAGVLDYAKLSLLAWVAVFFACGWIGAGSSVEGRPSDSRMLAGVMAVVMAPASLMLTFAALAIPLIQGDPRTFRTIRKTRER